jgi:3',5'-cyclic AMP phosphodiesterase CpdA
VGLRRVTRTFDRRLWPWCLGPEPARRDARLAQRLIRGWLTSRLRFAMGLRAGRYSLPTALSRGLQVGLPLAAILAATVPVWGMSWYFDTENWAAGIWNSWAEARTDTWREAMVRAVDERAAALGRPIPDYSVSPPGLGTGAGDFSFVVIGDTGEGDASQQSLRDQLVRAAGRDEVRFVVISSDVVYPTGAMRDYELKFWLQFKGVEKPVYAIPGNHDWYDALESFLATFLDADAARTSIRARIEADNRLTSTTEDRVESLIGTAARLRREYRVPTGFQQAPFFHVQTDRFALIAADTGVVRRLDDRQLAWFRRALEAARGKLTMVVLGHPFYAGGHYTAKDDDDFEALHALLRKHEVALVMAGDTHDLEYYVERSGTRATTHVVNGGGGAYLSFGTALAWPASPATAEWAYFPSRAQVTGKIDAMTPWWKAPAWWWTRRFGAWPFSAEWLSAAFDYNAAPFYQSFVLVHVDASLGRLRLWPIGVHGRLRWSDLEAAGGVRPSGVPPGAYVEWTIEQPGAAVERPPSQ